MVTTQFARVQEQIKEQKEDTEEKFRQKSVTFKQKSIQRQYEVNSKFLNKVRKTYRALKKKDSRQVKKLLRSLENDLLDHEEDLLIADQSDNGWLTFCLSSCLVNNGGC